MTIAAQLRQAVVERANAACEYCGVTEADAGGELSVDHFRPKSHGGSDDLSNLVYSCVRCNQYKADYWPSSSTSEHLWNPRAESAELHLLNLNDGRLHPLTAVGAFTLRRLRLNRTPLVAYRRGRIQLLQTQRIWERSHEILSLFEMLSEEQLKLLAEQRELSKEQRLLISMLLAEKNES